MYAAVGSPEPLGWDEATGPPQPMAASEADWGVDSGLRRSRDLRQCHGLQPSHGLRRPHGLLRSRGLRRAHGLRRPLWVAAIPWIVATPRVAGLPWIAVTRRAHAVVAAHRVGGGGAVGGVVRDSHRLVLDSPPLRAALLRQPRGGSLACSTPGRLDPTIAPRWRPSSPRPSDRPQSRSLRPSTGAAASAVLIDVPATGRMRPAPGAAVHGPGAPLGRDPSGCRCAGPCAHAHARERAGCALSGGSRACARARVRVACRVGRRVCREGLRGEVALAWRVAVRGRRAHSVRHAQTQNCM